MQEEAGGLEPPSPLSFFVGHQQTCGHVGTQKTNKNPEPKQTQTKRKQTNNKNNTKQTQHLKNPEFSTENPKPKNNRKLLRKNPELSIEDPRIPKNNYETLQKKPGSLHRNNGGLSTEKPAAAYNLGAT